MVPATAERRQMAVANALGGQRTGQRLLIELGRRPRAGDRAHVHEQGNARLSEKRHEFSQRPRGVADGEDRTTASELPSRH
jgi:hypothetical protein